MLKISASQPYTTAYKLDNGEDTFVSSVYIDYLEFESNKKLSKSKKKNWLSQKLETWLSQKN